MSTSRRAHHPAARPLVSSWSPFSKLGSGTIDRSSQPCGALTPDSPCADQPFLGGPEIWPNNTDDMHASGLPRLGLSGPGRACRASATGWTAQGVDSRRAVPATPRSFAARSRSARARGRALDQREIGREPALDAVSDPHDSSLTRKLVELAAEAESRPRARRSRRRRDSRPRPYRREEPRRRGALRCRWTRGRAAALISCGRCPCCGACASPCRGACGACGACASSSSAGTGGSRRRRSRRGGGAPSGRAARFGS